jgi:mRNA interferase MazF
MGAFTTGQVVLVDFPFSDLTASKVRPAVVLADAGRGEAILCQVTSNAYGDLGAIPLETSDFTSGTLRRASVARPGKLFTAHASLVVGSAGILTAEKLTAIRGAVVAIIQSG